MQSRHLSGIASAQAEAGDFDGAQLTARTIGTQSVQSAAFRSIGLIQATDGYIPAAYVTLRQIQQPGEQKRAILAVAATLGQQSPIAVAPQVADHLETLDEKIRFILSVADHYM